MWLHLHFYILVKFIFVAANVITLIKQNEIKCIVTDDSLYSAVYLISPTNYVNINRTNPEIIKNIYDWNITVTSSDLLGDPILDQRWIDFEVDRNKGVSLNTSAFPICFNESTNSARIWDRIYQNSTEWIPFNINKTNNNTYCEWNHYRIVKSDKNIGIYSGESDVYKTELNFTPAWIYFQKEFIFKKQKYEFLYSNTTNLNKSHVQVNSSKCISMFVSVDKDCYLNITLESGHKILNHTTVEGFNEKGAPKKWQRVQIQTESDGENMQLGFKRHRNDSETTGFWAIDEIQNCKSDFDTYTTTIANDTAANYTCKALNSSEVSNTSLSNDKIGNLGNINCTKILGQNYSFCEEHKICLGDQCSCAWGYQGSNCAEGCQSRAWGLDCKESCKEGCEICNATIGCTKCKEKYFGDDCSHELPVVKHAPKLTHIISDTTVEIFIQLEHNEKEADPDSYVIQYKNDSINNFKNYSKPISYTHSNNITTQMNLIRNCSYEIRIILICKGKFFDKNVPELVTYKKTLRAEIIENNITLKWDRPPNFENNEYIIYYMCNKKFCCNKIKQNTTQFVNETTFKIININPFKICSVQLFDTAGLLMDETKIESRDLSPQVQENELPKNVKVVNKTLHMELDDCGKFIGPLTYYVNYTCISSWCKNQSREWVYELKSYSADIQIKLDGVSAFTAYDVTIVAKRNQSENKKIYSNITTEPAKHQGVGNLSVYSKFDDTVWIKWKEPYPPRGIVEMYNITLVENGSGVQVNHTNSTYPCALWTTFICANISGLNTTTNYNIMVSARNYNVTEPGEPKSITTANLSNVSYPPENLQIFFSTKPNEIVVKWEHPLYTYGKIEKFYIEIDDGKSKNSFSINLGKNDKNYYQKSIPVNATDNEYKISVWGKSRFDGQNKTAKAIILETNNTVPILQWCTTGCYLTIQKISRTSFKGSVVQKKNTTYKREGRTLNDDEKNEFSCISDESGFPLCEIEEKVYEGLKSQTSCVKFTNDDATTCLDAKEETVERSVVVPVVAAVVALLLVLVCGLIFFVYRKIICVKRKYKSTETLKISEEHELQEKALMMKEATIKNESHYNPKPVAVENLEPYLLKSFVANRENNEIIQQFKNIPNVGPDNRTHGRSSDHFMAIYSVGDDTKIILNKYEKGEYINANYIDGFETPRAFIAAQAPLSSTISNFWQMVYEENVQTIVMLNKLKENGPVISEKYWPEDQTRFRYGHFLIENLSTKVTSNYVHQKLRINFKNQTCLIEHYQYVTWPNHKLPSSLQNFTKFIIEVMTIQQSSPVLVHCDSGCGRTGTFILSHIVLSMAIKTNQVDFFNVLKQMRDQRPHMVSDEDQYIFAHLVVWEYFFGQDFSISITSDFQSEVAKALHRAHLESVLSRLEKVEPFYMYYQKLQLKLLHLQLDANEEKFENRDSSMVTDHPQLVLPDSLQDSLNHIKAVRVDSYRYPKRFIVTQQPLPDAFNAFWKLIIEYKINTIVSLNEIDDDRLKFWPNESQRQHQVEDICTLSFLHEANNTAYKEIKLRVDSGDGDLKRVVHIIDIKNWKPGTCTPPNVADLLSVWEKIATNRSQIVVTCYDGKTASGFFVALASLLEEIDMERVCDVFTAISTVRQSCSEFVQNLEQVRYLYLAAVQFIRGFSTYENFKS